MRKLLLATSALLSASVGIVGSAGAGTLSPNAQNPAPGSITVTLNALVEAFLFDSTENAVAPQNNGGRKTATYGVATYSRLYPSFDGKLANGLKYGGSIEIRHNSGFNTSNRPSNDSTFYVQREFVYIGADQFGKVSIGSPVQPTELFQTGNPANFNTGGWDGDLNGTFRVGLPYFIDDDADRANKVVYVSPQFSGFDFGISFEPNAYGQNFGKYQTRQSSGLSSDGQFGERRNTVDGSARYQGTFGAVGIKANIGGSFGGTVRANDGTVLVPSRDYKNFSFLGGGISGTIGGLELDGHVDWGKFGPDFTPLPAGAGQTTSFVTGASYTIGPIIFGASYYGFNSGYTRPSSLSNSATHGYGLAAGGTYTLAPGASVFLEYLYGHQHANGTDLVNGGASTANNNTRSQAFGIGTAFKW